MIWFWTSREESMQLDKNVQLLSPSEKETALQGSLRSDLGLTP